MPNRCRSPLSIVLTLTALVALAACGQPTTTPIDPATLPQEFSFEVTNLDALSGEVFAPVFEPFGSYAGPMAVGVIAPAQSTALRDAMDGATLTAAGTIAGTLTPAAEVARVNEAIGFFMGAGEVFFVPEGCDVTAVNANDAAFSTVFELVVWDGTTLDADGAPASPDGYVDLVVTAGDVETVHLLVASRTDWSATSNGLCEVDATTSYRLDLDVTAGWQFLRATFDGTGGDEVVIFETRSLADVAAAGAIGVATPSAVILGQQAQRLDPIYR